MKIKNLKVISLICRGRALGDAMDSKLISSRDAEKYQKFSRLDENPRSICTDISLESYESLRRVELES